MPLFKHPDLIAKLCKSIADHARPKNIQAVAGLEARGIVIGSFNMLNGFLICLLYRIFVWAADSNAFECAIRAYS